MSFADFVDGLNAFCDAVGGLLLVGLFYWFRFQGPKGGRSYTTRALYCIGIIAFILPLIIIYAWVQDHVSQLTAIWILILLWLVPFVPGTWRGFCQRIAQIPDYAYAVRDQLMTAPFSLRAEDLPEVTRKLARIGYHFDDYRAAQTTAIQSRLLKIAAVMHHLGHWAERREAFIVRNAEHYSDLLRVYDLLSFKTVRVLKSAGAIYDTILQDKEVQTDDWHALDTIAARDKSINRLQSASQAAAGSMLEDLRKDMDFLLDNLLLFVARATLTSGWTFARRKRRLEAIGFSVERPILSITSAVVGAVAIAVVWSIAWFALLGTRAVAGNQDVGMMSAFCVTPLTLIGNFLLVYYFKRNYAFANEGMFGEYPYLFVLTVGLWTALLTFPVRVLFDYYQFKPQGTFGAAVVAEVALSLFPWAIGAVTAVLVQDSVWSTIKSKRVRGVLDGVVFGAGMVLVVLLLWMINLVEPMPQLEKMSAMSWLEFIFGFFGASLGFGFVIGYFVMARIREASSLHAGYNLTFAKERVVSFST